MWAFPLGSNSVALSDCLTNCLNIEKYESAESHVRKRPALLLCSQPTNGWPGVFWKQFFQQALGINKFHRAFF